ncbi:TniQ family protein [Streptomyces sp. ISL-94]|uniref:TniQ family protein n=1 Tax=Streptomyces sp. ISL-94 TaxID=2819190 RepID=UPI001BE7A8A4|nr:TniQ family protein [Streptomyces sp. ISL-94]MBT2481318.1 TniQ family protein [Streptomyces sp. ISL-94]
MTINTVAMAPAFSAGRLPYVVEPLQGEALDSWIEAYARQLIVTSREFLMFIGLPGAHLEHMLVKLLPEEAAVLTRRTGVEPEALRAMTLEPFDQITVTVRHTTRGLGSPPSWRRHKGSRYCPTCLAENGGRWQLSWRSPWTFACTQHAQLLVETCEGCGQRPHPAGRHPAGVTNPALCTMARDLARSSKGARLPCHTDLTTAVAQPIPADGEIIRAQHSVDTVIRGRTGRDRDPDQPHPSLDELFFLAWRGLATLHDDNLPIPQTASGLLEEAGGHTLALLTGLSNETATDVAVGTATAMTVLERGHPHSDAVLRWIADSHLRKDGSMEVLLKFNSWRTSCSPATVTRALTVIDSRLRIIDRLRFATTSPTPQPPAAHPELIERRAAAIPATLWPSWSMRLMPHQIGGPRGAKVAEFRAGLSTLLLMVRSTSRVYRDALALLGDTVSPSFVKSMITRLDRQYLTPLLAALTQLADSLDEHGSPIDYQRRRSLADIRLAIDRPAYLQLAAQNRWRTPTELSLDALDQYLRAMWIGTLTHTDHRLNDLRFRADPAVRAFLFDQAAGHLQRLGIDEPVTWEPPPEWVSGIPWPGTEPADISAEEFRRTAARHRKITDVADSLGIGIEHARLYVELASTIPTVQRKTLGTPRGPRTTAPDAAILHDLYVTQGLSLRGMSKATGSSVEVLKAALREAGIAIRRPRERASRGCRLDGDWLYDQYAVKCRGFAEIAEEVEMGVRTIRRIARTCGFPIRRHDGVPRDFIETTRGLDLPPAVYQAFCGRNAVQRVSNVSLLLDHSTIPEVAAACGIRVSDLQRQMAVVEKSTGIRLLDTSARPRLTAEGRQLLHDARPVVERYTRLYADNPGATSAVHGRSPRTAAPAPDILRDLYLEQGFSLHKLRDITGASITVLKQALSSAGIEIRRQGHRPGYAYRIDRDWLYEQYVLQHRTFTDIADEIGVVSTTVLNIARRHNIPIRSAVGVPRDFAATTQGLVIPPVVYRAFSGWKSVGRLKKISLLLDHHALETAAEAANVRPSELKRIAAIIEKDTGIPILQTVKPPRLTAAGRTLLQQVMPVLHRYDAVAGSTSAP